MPDISNALINLHDAYKQCSRVHTDINIFIFTPSGFDPA